MMMQLGEGISAVEIGFCKKREIARLQDCHDERRRVEEGRRLLDKRTKE